MHDGTELLLDYHLEPHGRILRAELRRALDWAGIRRLRRFWKRTDDEVARWLMGLGQTTQNRELQGFEHYCALASATLQSATSMSPGKVVAEVATRRVSLSVIGREVLAEVVRGGPWSATDATEILQVLVRVAKLPDGESIYWDTARRRLERADEDLASGFVRGFYQNLYYCWRLILEMLALRRGPWARPRHPTTDYLSSRQSADPTIEAALTQAASRQFVTGKHKDFANVLALLAEAALDIPEAAIEPKSVHRGVLMNLRRLHRSAATEISPAVRRLVRRGRLPRDVLWLEALLVRLYQAREHADYWHCFESRLLSSDRSEVRDATRLLLRVTEKDGMSRELLEVVPLHPPMKAGPDHAVNGWIETPDFELENVCQALTGSLGDRLSGPGRRRATVRLQGSHIEIRSGGNRVQFHVATDGFFELSLQHAKDEHAALTLLRDVFIGVVLELQRRLPSATIRWGELRGWSADIDDRVYAEVGRASAKMLDTVLIGDGFASLYRDPEGQVHAWQRPDGVTLILQIGEAGPKPLRIVPSKARATKTLWFGLEHSEWQLAQRPYWFEARLHHYASLHRLVASCHEETERARLIQELRAKLARLGGTVRRAKRAP
ncbi:MAG: hypothetical protein IT379_37970 [Deltaproteobacteria bacterium]|nr:hypothetical protein [Deltaproteobacteria bacterium]